MTLTRDIDRAESDQEKMEELDLIKKEQERAKPYLDYINNELLKHYELVLQPKLKVKRKGQKRPNFEEEL